MRTDQGRSFVPGDGCNRSGDQQEARKTCIPGRLIIKLATAGSVGPATTGRSHLRVALPTGPQASSLTAGPGYDRMNLERINYENKKVLR